MTITVTNNNKNIIIFKEAPMFQKDFINSRQCNCTLLLQSYIVNLYYQPGNKNLLGNKI